jgi:hypothetical protein
VLKQMLYFDRYVQALAPELEVFQDGRVSIGEAAANGGGWSGFAA